MSTNAIYLDARALRHSVSPTKPISSGINQTTTCGRLRSIVTPPSNNRPGACELTPGC
jgi:hypothetical protein